MFKRKIYMKWTKFRPISLLKFVSKRLVSKRFPLYLANSCHPREDLSSTACAFIWPFTEEEIDVKADVKALYKVNICWKNKGFTSIHVCRHLTKTSGPLLSSRISHVQNESQCKIFLVKISFICRRTTNNFHMTSHLASLWNRGLDNSEMAHWPIYAQGSEDWVGVVSKCIMGLIGRRYHFFDSVHTYLEIFENTDCLLRFWKNTRPHGAYSNRLRPSTQKRSRSGNLQGTQTTSYSKIRFSPITRKR